MTNNSTTTKSPSNSLNSRTWALTAGLIMSLAFFFTACDSKMGQGVTCPEVRVQYRGSILGSSLVIIITNSGSKPLFDVGVSSQRWSNKFRVSSNLKPGDSVEAGWLELPSGLKKGDVVEIFAEGFRGCYESFCNLLSNKFMRMKLRGFELSLTR